MGKFLGTVAKVALPIAGAAFGGPIGGAIGGAIGGGIGGGGIKSIATGGALGGLGGYVSQAGGVGNALSNGLNSAGFGNAAYDLANGTSGTLAGGLGSAINGVSNGFSSMLGSGGGSGGSGFGGLSTLANVGSALGTAYSANKIAGAQNAANQANQANINKALNTATTNMNPYIQSGSSANNQLSNLLGTSGNSSTAGYGSLTSPFTTSDFTADPGYQFRLQQGELGINRALGAQGGLFSGAALKEASTFNQGNANQAYQDAYSRAMQQRQQTYGMLSGQAGQGLQAAGNLASVGEGNAAMLGNTYNTQGNIAATQNTTANNAISNGLANILGSNVGPYTGGQNLNVSQMTPLQIQNLKQQLGIA